MKSWEMIYSTNINDLFKKTVNKNILKLDHKPKTQLD